MASEDNLSDVANLEKTLKSIEESLTADLSSFTSSLEFTDFEIVELIDDTRDSHQDKSTTTTTKPMNPNYYGMGNMPQGNMNGMQGGGNMKGGGMPMQGNMNGMPQGNPGMMYGANMGGNIGIMANYNPGFGGYNPNQRMAGYPQGGHPQGGPPFQGGYSPHFNGNSYGMPDGGGSGGYEGGAGGYHPQAAYNMNYNSQFSNMNHAQASNFKSEPGVWEGLPSMQSPPTPPYQSGVPQIANISPIHGNSQMKMRNSDYSAHTMESMMAKHDQDQFETQNVGTPDGSPDSSPHIDFNHEYGNNLTSNTGAFVRIPEQKRLFQGGKSGRNPISILVEVGFEQGFHAGSRCILTVDCEKDSKWQNVKHIILDKPLNTVEFNWSSMNSSGNKRVELRITLSTEGGPPLDSKTMAIGVYSNTNQRKSLIVSVALFYSAIDPNKVPTQFIKASKSKSSSSSSKSKTSSSRTREGGPEEMISLKSAQFWVNECWKLKFYNKEKVGLDFSPPDSDDWVQIIKTLRLNDYLTVREFERLVDWFFDAGEEALKVPEMWKRGAIQFCSTQKAEELLNRPDLFLIRFSSAGFLNFAFHQPSLPNNQGEIRPTNDEEVLYYIEILGKKGFNVVLKNKTVQVHEFLKEVGFTNNHKPREGKYGPIATMLSNKNPSSAIGSTSPGGDTSLPSTPSVVPNTPSTPATPSGFDPNAFDANMKKRRTDEVSVNSVGGPMDISVRSITRDCDVGCLPISNLDTTTLDQVRIIMRENLDDDQVSAKFYFANANGSKISSKQESMRTVSQVMSGHNLLIVEEGLGSISSPLGY
eukprot:TRINITY_DN6279_c0_g1_i1.p1 TRINITY_DN6279_c0_g1~~TRINITY_DN6279_c0_g1_i1.p1  ORF type:complete len:812 (+),score=260.06 TRINITY_DN6279_c0_g1_i1:252-2687(+)